MLRINLLPHREARRKQKKAAFLVLLALAAAVGTTVVLMVGGYNAARIAIQNERNQVIKQANGELDKKIAEIATLKEEIEGLKARQQAVEDLQGDRNQPVYLMDELVKQTPAGVYLRSIKQDGQRVAITGVAQSQERVAELLRNLASGSPWLERPEFGGTQASTLDKSKTGKKVFDFSVTVGIKRPRDKEAAAANDAKGARAGAKAGASSSASGALPPKPALAASAAAVKPASVAASAPASSQERK
ncbi:MAG: PilN domain-containing protein [Pseudomonadota bacterium]